MRGSQERRVVYKDSSGCLPLTFIALEHLSSSLAMEFACFGVEIEAIVEPHRVREPLSHSFYFERLAQALRKRNLNARADQLNGDYRKHSEHYDKWWITKDGSLGKPRPPESKSGFGHRSLATLRFDKRTCI
jgi:hypothetical protein